MFGIVGVSLVGLVVGGIAAIAAIVFVDGILWLNDLLLVSMLARGQVPHDALRPIVVMVLVPAMGGLIVGLIGQHLIAERRGLGPPDAILAVQTRERLPSFKSGLATTVAALVSLGFGASVGQYGPLVYLGAMIGGLADRLQRQIRDIGGIAIACGVAAAIATAFNAPIAGLVFAHEVILRHYSIRAFAPVAVAAAIGYVIDNVAFHRPPLLLVVFSGFAHSFEFLLFAILGMLSAGLAIVYMRALLAGGRLGGRVRLPLPLKATVAGLVLGVVSLAAPEILGVGFETMRLAMIEGGLEGPRVLVLLGLKIVATAFCLGMGFIGGVFSPALLVGILGGTLFGLGAEALSPLPVTGVVPYAVCGMMAVTSAVIGAPLATILIVFELTRSYDLTIAAMVAVVFSNLITYRAFGRSFFDVQLMARDVDLSRGRDMAMLGQHPVRRHLDPTSLCLGPDDTIADLLAKLRNEHSGEAVLADHDGRYLGMLRLQAAVTRPPATALAEIADTTAITFDDETTLWDAIGQLRDVQGNTIPYLDEAGRLEGTIAKTAVIDAYLHAINDLRREENAA